MSYPFLLNGTFLSMPVSYPSIYTYYPASSILLQGLSSTSMFGFGPRLPNLLNHLFCLQPTANGKVLHEIQDSQSHETFSSIELKSEEETSEVSTLSEFSLTKQKKFSSKSQLRHEIEAMLQFFLEEFHHMDLGQFEQEKEKYSSNPVLLSLFDHLWKKYSSTNKFKEEMNRFVLRKAISSIRDSIRNEQKLTAKLASIKLCQRYFEIDDSEIKEPQLLMSSLLPYKRGSRNKTPNSQFVSEIFSSEQFCKDYQLFLDDFDNIMKNDNAKRIERFISCLIQCVEKKNFQKIKSYKRLPWLNHWISTSKLIASDLLTSQLKKNNKSEILSNKKAKKGKIL